jgi:adenylate kinase
MPQPLHAIALIGHSNAGKSPLGTLIEQQAASEARRYLHVDFGELLRQVAAGMRVPGLEPADRAHVAAILNGTLLDDAHFHIAQAIINDFVVRRKCTDHDFLVLNGLPRHFGQAKGLVAIGVHIERVFYCACTSAVAWERKRLADQGRGHEDRRRRTDGAYPIFRAKIESFERDTVPLIDYYEQAEVPVVTVPVDAGTTPEQMFAFVKHYLSAADGRSPAAKAAG